MISKENKKVQSHFKEGLIHVYTGNGKGKTTAALGLALRALGAGLRVFVAQFIKQGEFSEIKALTKLSKIKGFKIDVRQYGEGRFIFDKPNNSSIALAKNALEDINGFFKRNDYDLYILDEACCAIKCKLLAEEDLLELIANKPKEVEIIITGRDATKGILKKADYITEMRCIKHPYHTKKIKARQGIEY